MQTESNNDSSKWSVDGQPITGEEARQIALQALWQKLGQPMPEPEKIPYMGQE